MGEEEERMGRDLSRRLEALEERAAPEEAPEGFPDDWPLEDQAEDMLEKLLAHTCTRTVYPATDRELNVLGLLHAYFCLPGGVGEYRFPSSGVVITLSDNGEDGTQDVGLSGNVCVEDLPEAVQERVERMSPHEQPERERYLHELHDHPEPKRGTFLEKYAGFAVGIVRGEGGA